MKSIKMNLLNFGLSIVFSIAFLSCKHHHHEVSPELKQAYEIQTKTLEENKVIAGLLKASNIDIPKSLLDRRDNLLNSMIEIPGMDHDHSNCNHDHKRPTFQISDAQMIEVQSVWRDSILTVNQQIKSFLNQN